MCASPNKLPGLVGAFLRERREAMKLSQRALGQLFNPPVTTQFISNVERGVTPLPPCHVPALITALAIEDYELTSLMGREYSLKLSGRLGLGLNNELPLPNGELKQAAIAVSDCDLEFMKKLYQAYQQADAETRQALSALCENVLKSAVSIGDKKS